MKLEPKDLFPITHYEYKEAYFGSFHGIRFRIAREPFEDVHSQPKEVRENALLQVTIWPEPNSYQTASPDSKTVKTFPFSQEGLVSACEWINTMSKQGC